MAQKTAQKIQRQARVRRKIQRQGDKLRLSVFRSNQHIYAQIIDDAAGKTLAAVSETAMKDAKGTKIERAKTVGVELAKLAKTKKITAVVFDKGAYSYHGRVKAVAEGAREGGLVF